MANDVPMPPFRSLTRMEEIIWDGLLAMGSSERRVLSADVPATTDSSVTGKFLRWLLLEAIPAVELAIARVDLIGITVADDLDLEGTKLGVQIRFVNCTFRKAVKLNDASAIGLEFVSGFADRIEADRLTTTGSLEIRKAIPTEEPDTGPFVIGYRLRLCGAEMRGNLDMRGCTLRGDVPPGGEPIPLFADGLTVKGNVLLNEGFSAEGEIRLNGAKIRRNLDCSGASLTNQAGYSLSAAGAHIEGTTYLCRSPESIPAAQRRPFQSIGTVRLEGANIEGDLDCTGGNFTAGPFHTNTAPAPTERDRLYAIKAGGLRVGANLNFNSRADGEFVVKGAIGLINATVGDDFECNGGIFDFPGEEMLVADGMVVSGTTFFDDAHINGIIRFAQASLKEGLYVRGARFDPTPICRAWFDEDNASWRDLGSSACGIYAPLAEVGGTFWWQRNVRENGQERSKYWLYLPNSKANIVRDDAESWQALKQFEVNGCQYGVLASLLPYQWRLSELDRQYAIENKNGAVRAARKALRRALGQWWRRQVERAACIARGTIHLVRTLFGRPAAPPVAPPATQPAPPGDFSWAVEAFKPQPYLQLAKAFRNAGYENIANEILVHYQRNKTRYSDFGVLRQIGRWFIDLFLQYGFSPFRPIAWLLGSILLSAVVFEVAYLDGKILPSRDLEQIAKSPAPIRPRFNAVLYSIDTLVPIVDFNQKKSWTVEWIGSEPSAINRSPPGPPQPQSWYDLFAGWCAAIVEVGRSLPRHTAALLLVFNTFFGWLMTSLFVAGVSGLMRTGREEG